MTQRQPRTPVVGSHFTLEGDLAQGASIGASATKTQMVRVGGALKCAIRAKLGSGTANLNLYYIRPTKRVLDGDLEFIPTNKYAQGNPTTLALTTTEAQRNIDDLRGEAYLLIEVVDGGTGCTIDYLDVSLL